MNIESILTSIVGVALTTLFTTLLCFKKLSQPSYIFLFSLTVIACLVLHGFPRLKELDLKSLKMTLEKIETAKQEIYAKQDEVNRTTTLLTELVLFQNAMSQVTGDKELRAYERLWLNNKCSEILNQLGYAQSEQKQIFRYQRAVDDIFALDGLGIFPKHPFTNVINMIKSEYGIPPRNKE